MNFDNLSQVLASVQTLHTFYPVIRIWDRDKKRLLYENEGTDIETESTKALTVFSKATIHIRSQEGILEVCIPVTIGGQPCKLELLQYDDRRSGTNSLLQMHRLMITDALTNLYNRRFIDEQLPIILERAFRSNTAVSFVYADIDYFKKINDHYGHIAGDYILKEISDVFQKLLLKKEGWVARYGGDEFLFCLPGANQNTAAHIANKIRHAVEVKRFSISTHFFKITCSLGVQTFSRADDVLTVNQVIRLLDKKLYQAKRNGRNQVVI